MKHLKIKLSVLALACLGAGALALQSAAPARAEDTFNVSGLTMDHGAAVSVKEDFSGIRWKTNIKKSWYEGLSTDKNYEFGVIVMPTEKLGDDGELTHEDTNCLDLPAGYVISEDEDGNRTLASTKFYSIVNYEDILTSYGDDLTEEQQKAVLAKAYAMELTARAYVKIVNPDDETAYTYEYADVSKINTSRSARQVAISAELNGDLDKLAEGYADRAAQYYSAEGRYVLADENKNTGAIGTTVIDLAALKTTTQGKVDFSGSVVLPDGTTIEEVLVDSERVKLEGYKEGTDSMRLSIKAGTRLPTGETYVVLFTSKGIYTVPVICATKVLKTTDDLKMFSKTKGTSTESTKVKTADWETKYRTDDQQQDGYYVLGKNINASDYTHGSGNDSSWNGADKYEGKPMGLTGTFNGMGYKIDGMTIGTAREGFFGLVNGGTVKNVAFLNVKAKNTGFNFAIANYLVDATFENFYITTDDYETHKEDVKDENGNPVYVTDEDGNPVYETDADGNKIQETDADGNPKVDDNGDPVYKKKVEQKTVVDSIGFVAKNSAILANYAYGKNVFRNCNVVFETTSSLGTDAAHGILFSGNHAHNYAATYENVHVASGNNFQYNYTPDGGKETKSENIRQRLSFDYKNKVVLLAENEVVVTGEGEEAVTTPTNLTDWGDLAALFTRVNYTYHVLKGVYRYKNLTALKNVEAAIAWMPAAWLA